MHACRLWLAMGLLAGCTAGTVGKDDPDTVGIGDAELLGILVEPENVVIPRGQSVQLLAKGLLGDRSSTELTAVVEWTVDDVDVVGVSNSLGSEGRMDGLAVGLSQVVAKMNGVESVPARVKVTDAQLAGLTVDPTEVTVAVGQEVKLTATAEFSDGTRSDASSQVRWITGNGGVATMGANGLLTATGEGSAQIEVRWDTVQAPSVQVNVQQGANPDVVVTGIHGEESGAVFRVVVDVANHGSGTASEVFVDVFVDPSETPSVGSFSEDWGLVPQLGPGETGHVTVEVPSGSAPYTVWAVVDTEDIIAEGDESNNVAAVEIEVQAGGAVDFDSDLEVLDVDAVVVDGTVVYDVTIGNFGDVPAPSFWADVFTDRSSAPPMGEDGDDYQLVEGLEGWTEVTLSFEVTAACEGSCSSWIVLDSLEEVDESDENNNVHGPVTVTPQPAHEDPEDTGWP